MQRFDVIVVGLGPVGAVLAARLQSLGASVLVVERDAEPFPLPRAIAADDEVQELLARTGPGLVEPMLHDQPVRFVAGDRVLGTVLFPRSAGGFCGLAFFDQPDVERSLRGLVTCARLGVSLRSYVDTRTGIEADLSDGTTVRADWLVGCDGAGSVVRRLAGIAWRGRELGGTWRVVDAVGDAGRPGFTYTCDRLQPSVDMPRPGGHRWEFLLRRGSAVPEVPLPVLRSVDYRFSARRAATWRVGRVLLAGDAAHTMPPFAGQGLGAGLRDAFALAALFGRGDPAGYEQLRAPHVREMTRLSLMLGSLLQSPAGPGVLRAAFATPGLAPWLSAGGPRRPASGVLDL